MLDKKIFFRKILNLSLLVFFFSLIALTLAFPLYSQPKDPTYLIISINFYADNFELITKQEHIIIANKEFSGWDFINPDYIGLIIKQNNEEKRFYVSKKETGLLEDLKILANRQKDSITLEILQNEFKNSDEEIINKTFNYTIFSSIRSYIDTAEDCSSANETSFSNMWCNAISFGSIPLSLPESKKVYLGLTAQIPYLGFLPPKAEIKKMGKIKFSEKNLSLLFVNSKEARIVSPQAKGKEEAQLLLHLYKVFKEITDSRCTASSIFVPQETFDQFNQQALYPLSIRNKEKAYFTTTSGAGSLIYQTNNKNKNAYVIFERKQQTPPVTSKTPFNIIETTGSDPIYLNVFPLIEIKPNQTQEKQCGVF